MTLALARIRAAAASCALAVALSAAPSLAPLPAIAQPAEGMIAQDARTKVSDHVWVILDDNRSLIPNVGIVVGEKATLIIDTGTGDRNGAVVLGEARKLGDNTEFYLSATHFHPEHDLGANGFPAGAKMLRWSRQQSEAEQDGATMIERFKSFSPAIAELLDGVKFRAPDVLFEQEITVDLGGVHVRLFGVGPNHTRGDTSFFVVEDKVLFTGDTAMAVLPAVSAQHASLVKWLENLDQYERLAPVSVVPAHGKLIDVSAIRRYREYLTAVQTRATAAKREGLSAEATVERLASGLAQEFADLAPANGAAGRINAAIQAAYREAR